MANLVIIESPNKAPAIKNYLGSGYKVVASVGHIRDLPKSTLGVDLENDFAAHYINIRGKGDLIKELKKEAKAADKVFLATDPDREGEAIAWHLSTVLGIPLEQTRRVSFNEITKSVVRAAIKKPRNIDINLVNSQQARRILDRIVGYKLSPFLWKTVRGGLSAGRVQSVTTRIIVDREKEIDAFEPEEYWTIDCRLAKEDGAVFDAKFYGGADGKIELHSEADAQKILDDIAGKPFEVLSVKRTMRQKNPAAPFTTSTMQQEASRKLGFHSQRIMKVAQELYEGINLGSENGGVQGIISYMRTDSQRVSEEATTAAKAYITEKFGESFYPPQPRVYKSKNNAQDAHEAIRPTNITLEPDAIKRMLTPDQYKLYKLIWSRFAASQMASAEVETVSAEIGCGGYIFRASGHTVTFPGYLTLYDDSEGNEEDKSGKLPALAEKEAIRGEEITPVRHFTEPPPRYNEASLIKFMEEKGIGRPSTYAPIITTIISRGYVERDGRSLCPTQLGEITTQLMMDYFPDIVDYEFTAQMEDDLDNIEHGETSVSAVLHSFYDEFALDLQKAEEQVGDVELPVEETDIICEKCGRKMIIKNGRYGRFAACPGYPECKNTKPITPDGKVAEPKAEKTDLKCELCGADMVLKTGRYGSFYACSRYPECKFTKQLLRPIGVKCPVCGGEIVTRRGKKSVFYSCENYEKCGFSSWDMPLNEKCPDCGQLLFRKKGKNLAVCHNPDCGYKCELPPAEPIVKERESDETDD